MENRATETFVALTAALGPQLPLLTAYMAGIGLAIFWWRRHPLVSMSIIAASAVLLGTGIVWTILFTVLPPRLQDQGWSGQQVGRLIGTLGIVRTLISTVAWIAVLYAVFGQRSAANRTLEKPF